MRPHREMPGQLPGSIGVEDEGGRRVLFLRGELDGAVVARFRAQQGSEPVVVDAIDAAAVTFISSTGVAVMLRCVEASAAAGRTPVLRSSSHVVDQVLEMFLPDRRFARPDVPRDAGDIDP
jgi:anti-anti-sigma regulatory factor